MPFEAMRSGETIRNHATGETLTMLEGEQESGGCGSCMRYGGHHGGRVRR